MYTGCTIWQNQVKPQHICPYTSAPTFDIQQVHSTNLQSSHLANASTPIPRCVVGECALLIPLSQLSQKGRLVEWCRGGRGGVWQSLPPPPEGGNGELTRPRSKAAGVDRSYQLSGVSWVSMSTLQMGHFLLVASHWSTHPWWKRCMQGNLLQTQDFKMKFRTSKKMFSNNKSLCFETGLSAKCQLFQNSPVFSSDI